MCTLVAATREGSGATRNFTRMKAVKLLLTFFRPRLRARLISALLGMASMLCIAAWQRRRHFRSINKDERRGALRPASLSVAEGDCSVQQTDATSCSNGLPTPAFRKRLHMLTTVPLFQRMRFADFPLLAQAIECETFSANHVLTLTGQSSASVHVIAEGEAIVDQAADRDAHLNESWPSLGDCTDESDSPGRSKMLYPGEYFDLGISRHNGEPPTVRAGRNGVMVLSLQLSKLDELGLQISGCMQEIQRHPSYPKTETQKRWLLTKLAEHLNPTFDLNEEQLGQLVDVCSECRFEVGEVVVVQGGFDELLHLVEHGSLSATHGASLSQFVLTSSNSGDNSPFSDTFSPSSSFPGFISSSRLGLLSPCGLTRPRKILGSPKEDFLSPLSSFPEEFLSPLQQRSMNTLGKNKNDVYSSGQVVGIAEAFIGAPNAATLTAEEPSVLWALSRSAIQQALHPDAAQAPSVASRSMPAGLWRQVTGGSDNSLEERPLEDLARRLVREETTPRLEDLDHIGVLGEGTFGSVSKVQHKGSCGSGFVYALKKIGRKDLNTARRRQSVMNEREVMSFLDSIFIVRLFTTYHDADSIYFLLENVPGGDLFEFMDNQRHNISDPEAVARFTAACVALAVQHMHSRKVIYRDMKPENILVDEKGYMKICDFGLSKLCMGSAYTLCGTAAYFAPEALKLKGYTHMVDWWSLGILTYELISGQQAFGNCDDDLSAIAKAIHKGINHVCFQKHLFSKSAKSLVRHLCDSSPLSRLGSAGGLEEVRCHAFFASIDWLALAQGEFPAPVRPQIMDPCGNTTALCGPGVEGVGIW